MSFMASHPRRRHGELTCATATANSRVGCQLLSTSIGLLRVLGFKQDQGSVSSNCSMPAEGFWQLGVPDQKEIEKKNNSSICLQKQLEPLSEQGAGKPASRVGASDGGKTAPNAASSQPSPAQLASPCRQMHGKAKLAHGDTLPKTTKASPPSSLACRVPTTWVANRRRRVRTDRCEQMTGFRAHWEGWEGRARRRATEFCRALGQKRKDFA